MALELFDFDYHTPTTKYPDTGGRMKLGNSYTYTVAPTAPDQRIITLHFTQMVYFCDPETGDPDLTTSPAINFNRLEAFYQRHRLHADFNYEHPVYGMLVVKFSKPLETPTTRRGGYTEPFTIELEEQP